ncbi:hypothetical protein [Erwinia oleae]|uniref:hypothetical protein n=1 Tax=Erwinia oleae TaxID=796334 RepID=UPI00055861A2|nr:hypothetical protein [Erwinia oleae]
MKKVLMLLTALAVAGTAQAEDQVEDGSQTYVANLCTVALQEKAPTTADEYIAQMKNLTARSQSSSSIEKPEFDEDEARTVVAAWMNLSAEEKKKASQSEQACQDATLQEYQSQD